VSTAVPGDRSGGLELPRQARITTSDEIRAIFRRGKRRKTRHLDVFVSTSPVARSRVGIVVPKPRQKTLPKGLRARGAAVQRNRLKRRLREIARTVLLPSFDSRACLVDVLIRARPEAYGASFPELRDQLAVLEEWICSSER
jgi:ribonuclease P protein component